jgi:superfamily I DNA/RNA helicase
MKPTQEQMAAIEAAKAGESFPLIAVAGSGKTTTLRLIAEELRGKRILFLAFNRSVKEEAGRKFPPNTSVSTAHGFAFGQVVRGTPYEAKFRGSFGASAVLEHMEVEEVLGYSRVAVAIAIAEATKALLYGAEPQLPEALKGLDEREAKVFLGYVKAKAQEAVNRMKDPEDPFPMAHDAYVQVWAERGGPGLEGYDLVLVDEAQDLNPTLIAPLKAYQAKGGQVIAVGDPRQQIYAWRGAVNAMEAFGGSPKTLSQSFRFGEAIAEVAREIAGVKVLGNPSVHSQVVSRSGPPEDGAAFVFRTNARLIVEAASYSGRYRVQVLGDTKELQDLVEAGLRLKEGKPTRHPLLAYFRSYQELLRAAELSPELKALRRLLENYRDPLKMLKAISGRGSKGKPHYVFSTVHKAKGLEWDVVVVGDDFPDPEKAGPEEVNLRYVAATRAKRVLDLRW